ncbi:MAG TPA: hypothetical protein VJB87_02565 [Candidatus Nanoarchaeia archaeon]|nr:hypothetical protein [Candidatus Nanoarchaeia archaeon]
MTVYDVRIQGRNFVDKHTHYEATVAIGGSHGTVIIHGDVVPMLSERHGALDTCDFRVAIDFRRNGARIAECRDPFKGLDHLMGVLSLEDIGVLEP